MKSAVKKIIDYAVEVSAADKIILFGSMANGRGNRHSDVDLLIISKSRGTKKEIRSMISGYAAEYCLKADVFIYSKEELQDAVVKGNYFIRAIIKTGRVMYEK